MLETGQNKDKHRTLSNIAGQLSNIVGQLSFTCWYVSVWTHGKN